MVLQIYSYNKEKEGRGKEREEKRGRERGKKKSGGLCMQLFRAELSLTVYLRSSTP